MFNTRNILIAVGVVIAITLAIYFYRQKKKDEIVISTSEGDVKIKAPEGTMDNIDREIRLDALNATTPIMVRKDDFPLAYGSEGERVKRLQNFLYTQHRNLNNGIAPLDFAGAGEAGKFGNYTLAYLQKYTGKQTIEEPIYKTLRIDTYSKP